MRMTQATSDDIRKCAEWGGNKELAHKAMDVGYWPPEDKDEHDKLALEVAIGGLEYIQELDQRSVDEIKIILKGNQDEE